MISIVKDFWQNQISYVLENEELRIRVSPEDGMNISEVRFEGQMIVEFDKERYQQGQTQGMPILFPTPNRIENQKFRFEGIEYGARLHGFTKNQHFQVINIIMKETEAFIEGIMVVSREMPIYELFPFESTLRIKITVRANELEYQYTLNNEDEKNLPYGFASHPFFCKNEENVQIQVMARKVMQMTEKMLPTGQLIEVQNTEFELNQLVSVESHILNHVYTDLYGPYTAKIIYEKFEIELHATKDFSHIVVFTPKDTPYFCIENQTCSTDAHNMFEKGFKEVSGLQILPAKGENSGTIKWKFNLKSIDVTNFNQIDKI